MDRVSVQEECLMHRFYIESEPAADGSAFLSPEDARHAVTVLRLRPGQHIEAVFSGEIRDAEILSTDARDVRIRMLSVLPSREPSLSVTLFQGLPKSDKMDLIVQKATELGVSRIVPVIMNRCVVRPDPKDMIRRLDRWRKIIREAAKQSGRCVIPELSDAVTLPRLVQDEHMPELNVVLWEEAVGRGPLAFRNDHCSLSSLGVLIGPEGGIEKEEVDLLTAAGFIPLTLGKRILRTETAGLAAVAAFMGLYGEME